MFAGSITSTWHTLFLRASHAAEAPVADFFAVDQLDGFVAAGWQRFDSSR